VFLPFEREKKNLENVVCCWFEGEKERKKKSLCRLKEDYILRKETKKLMMTKRTKTL